MIASKWRPLIAIRTWVAGFALISAALLAGGYFYYRMEAGRILDKQYENLATIAGMKAEQIQHWRNERIADAVRSAAGPMLIKNTRAMIDGLEEPVIKDELRRVLEANRSRAGYTQAAIIKPGGEEVLISVPGGESVLKEAAAKELIGEISKSMEPKLTDFYRAGDEKTCIDAAAPIRDENGRFLGTVLLRSDAGKGLYPAILAWPTPSRSAETLLVRREKDGVVFLNELRHRSGTALSLRMPITQEDLPAAQAVLGKRGFFRGRDYRGVEVLADLRPISGSPWYMVTKVDSDEMLAEARYRAYSIAIIVAAAISLAAALVAYAYRQRQVGVYQELFEAERQKRLDREQFRTTLYSIGDGIITTDTGSRVREMNRVAEKMTGWTEEEARGQNLETVFKIINQDTRAKVINPVGTVLREGVIVGLANHTLLIARDGTERAIADSAAPIRDESGKVSGVVLVFSDVTEKYRVEAALKKSEQEYRMLFASMIDGFAVHEAICDSDGRPVDYRFVSVNPAFERLAGRPASEIVGRKFSEVFPEMEPGWLDVYTPVVLEGKSIQTEKYSPALQRYIEVAAFSPRQGQFATVLADITERKKAENALRESEARFRGLFQNVSSVAVRSFGPDFKVQYWNKGAENVYGYTADEAIGENSRDLLFTPEALREIERFNPVTAAESREQPAPLELLLKRKDGTPVTVISSMALVQTAGKPCEFFCFDIDITERKRLEMQILRTQRMESIGTLASGVAHDLNNILAPIILSADLLRNEDDPVMRSAFVDTIETCAHRGANIVNQVITFARGATGEKTTLQLRHLVDEMEKIVRETFPRNISVSNNLPGDLWPIKGNPTQIHQVLLNLCINARDAMPNGGRLTLNARNETIDHHDAAMIPEGRPGCFVSLEISDTGLGIPVEIIGKIFDPFFTTKDVGKGTGLGLSTVSGIVRGHGGFISIASERENGATFTLYFPADFSGIVESASVENTAVRRGEGETILVVDDDAPVCQAICSVLKLNGYTALPADSGVRALEVYRDRAAEIRLVLTDVSMPGMDGVELIRQLRTMTPHLKIIASSGKTTEEIHGNLNKLRVAKVLHKPYDAAKLLDVIAGVVRE